MDWEVVPKLKSGYVGGMSLRVCKDGDIYMQKALALKLGKAFMVVRDKKTGALGITASPADKENARTVTKSCRFKCDEIVHTMNLEPGDEIRTKLDGNVYLLLKPSPSTGRKGSAVGAEEDEE